jgi:hypothetical protein
VGTFDEFIHLCEDGTLEWSKHVIDADVFYGEKEAQDVANHIIEKFGIFVGVSWRSDTPQPFLFTNPYLPPRDQRVRKHGELPWLDRELGRIRSGEIEPKIGFTWDSIQ